MATTKCNHDWVKFGFPLDGNWYVTCTKCGASRSSKPRAFKKEEDEPESVGVVPTENG